MSHLDHTCIGISIIFHLATKFLPALLEGSTRYRSTTSVWDFMVICFEYGTLGCLQTKVLVLFTIAFALKDITMV